MEGVISTTSFVDGRFMEREVDINTILSGNTSQERINLEADKPPKVGLLSQTVIDSPNNNWILPARLGNLDDHDVVFIGDNSLQIKRLIKSGQLSEVGLVTNLGSRIRNAKVLGSIKLNPSVNVQISGGHRDSSKGRKYGDSDKYSDSEDKNPKGALHGDLFVNSVAPSGTNVSESYTNVALEYPTSSNKPEPGRQENHRLGPQIVALVLEAGDLMFLCAPDLGPGALIQPILRRHNIAKPLLGENPGAHLTVDPSSRYLALACSENVVSIYSLQPREAIEHQYFTGQPLAFIKEERFLHVKGVILKIEFLFPSFEDPDHIILLLLIARKGKTRMHVYEWVSGQPLSAIRQNHMNGHLLEECYRTPLLLIPLTIKSAFVLVCEQIIAVCEGLLEGSPQCRPLHIGHEEPSPIHKGRNFPLWTSWTRPVRTEIYAATHDDIYIAREDGLVKYLESNLNEFLCPEMNVEGITCNIGTAFASLDSKFPGTDGVVGDILVIGGDSCPGGLYWVQARQPAKLLTTLQNWAPLNDFVTIPGSQLLLAPEQSQLSEVNHGTFWNAEKILGCTGRGPYGTVSELNRGIEAEIWMELNELDSAITGAWPLPQTPKMLSHEEKLTANSTLLLLTTGHESQLLMLENHGSGITGVVEVDSSWLDLSSPTLDACYARGFITQISERYIRVSNKPPSSFAKVYSETFKPNEVVVTASIYQNEFACIAFQTQNGQFRIDAFSIEAVKLFDSQAFPPNKPVFTKIGTSLFVGFYPTFLSFADPREQVEYVVLGHGATDVHSNPADFPQNVNTEGGSTTSCVYRFHKSQGIIHDDQTEFVLSGCQETSFGPMHSCVSALMISQPENAHDATSSVGQHGLLLAGHATGVLSMTYYAQLFDGKIRQRMVTTRQLGATNLKICRDPSHPAAALVCCGSDLYRIVYNKASYSFPPITRILFMGRGVSIYRQPSIDFVSRFDGGFLAISGKQILGIEIRNKSTGVSNSIELPGSAQRILYCKTTESLVVAGFVDGYPAIVFLGKGEDKTQVVFLKHTQSSRHTDRIISLAQRWLNTSSDLPPKDRLIVAGTSSGNIFLLRQDKNLNNLNDLALAPKATKFRVFIKQRFSDPVYAILQDGPDDGILFCCIGSTLHSMLLNINEETLVSLSEYQLPSHAVSMTWDNQYLNVLTAKDSIMTLLYSGNGKLQLQFVDESARTGLDHMSFPLDDSMSPGAHSSVLLVSDKDCSVVGLHYLRSTSTGQIFPREYTTLFEAEIPSCTTKFRLATVRPKLDINQDDRTLAGVISWTNHGEDLLGISIDGSMRRFTLVNESLLKLLGILEHLARQDLKICPARLQEGGDIPPFDQDDIRNRHIDGDVLKGWLVFRNLEEFLTKRASTQIWATHIENFLGAVAIYWPDKTFALDGDERLTVAMKLVYHLLEQLLGPVMQ